jgi:hypothetical protein
LSSLLTLKWIDVVQDRDLPQQHLADHVGGLDMLGENRSRPGAAGREAFGKFRIIEPYSHDQGDSLYLLRRHGGARRLHLTARDRLQDAFDPAGHDQARCELEGKFDGFPTREGGEAKRRCG